VCNLGSVLPIATKVFQIGWLNFFDDGVFSLFSIECKLKRVGHLQKKHVMLIEEGAFRVSKNPQCKEFQDQFDAVNIGSIHLSLESNFN